MRTVRTLGGALALLLLAGGAQALDVNALKNDGISVNKPVDASDVDGGLKLVPMNDEGLTIIKTPNGNAITVTGSAPYKLYPNMDASAISKREAYARAFARARADLASYLKGATTQNLEEFGATNEDIVKEDKTLTNRQSQSTEGRSKMIQATLRSYVVYKVLDRPNTENDGGDVYVTLVTSPRVIDSCQVITNGYMTSPNLAKGVDYVMAELQKGVTPPVGARLIRVPASDEMAVVAFGSEVILSRGSRTEARRSALRRADLRASGAMIQALKGSHEVYITGMAGELKESEKNFERISKTDLFGNTQESLKELGETLSTFKREMSDSEAQVSLTAGRLPAGLKRMDFRSADDRWAYVVLIYMPSLTSQARELSDRMDKVGAKAEPQAESAPTAPTKLADPGRGPSGQVQDASDL